MLVKVTGESDDVDIGTLHALAQEGHARKLQLEAFASALPTANEDAEPVLSRLYYHAASIYLSGVFEQSGSLRQTGICGPILTASEVCYHLEGILSQGSLILQKGGFSPLLLLTPLRIAGNRCATSSQCRQVLEMIAKVDVFFAVAHAFRTELEQIWSSRALLG